MRTYHKFEDGDRFGLSWRESTYGRGDDLGRGAENVVMRFGSAEAREYYIQARNAEDARDSVQSELTWLRREVLALISDGERVRRKRVLELTARLRARG